MVKPVALVERTGASKRVFRTPVRTTFSIMDYRWKAAVLGSHDGMEHQTASPIDGSEFNSSANLLINDAAEVDIPPLMHAQPPLCTNSRIVNALTLRDMLGSCLQTGARESAESTRPHGHWLSGAVRTMASNAARSNGRAIEGEYGRVGSMLGIAFCGSGCDAWERF